MNRVSSAMKVFPKPLRLFLSGMVLANIASMMYDPLLPLYLQHLGADVRQVGLFFTISAILPLLFQIFGGWISDSIGRLKAVAIGSVTNLFTFAIFLLSPSWEWALLAMATGAIGRAFVAPSFRAFVAEQSTESNRGKIYGVADTIYAVVGVLGPPLGGFLSDRYGYTVMFIVAAVFFTLATILRIAMAIHYDNLPSIESSSDIDKVLEEKRRPSLKGLKSSIGAMVALLVSGGLATWILITDGIIDINFNLIYQLYPIFMSTEVGINNTQIGILISISAFVAMALKIFGGWMSDRNGERFSIVLGMGGFALSLILFAFSSNFSTLVISYAMFGFGRAFLGPAYSSLISKAVPENLRGLAFGIFSTSIGLVSFPAPYIGAWMYETFNPRLPFLFPTIALIISMPIAWKKFHLKKTKNEIPVGVPSPAE